MTKFDKVKNYLLEGGWLSDIKCRELFHTTSLISYVSRMRKRGMKIHGEKVDHVEDNDYHYEYYIKNTEVNHVHSKHGRLLEHNIHT